jgi:aspartate/methionine/tyrosine aminotransferase
MKILDMREKLIKRNLAISHRNNETLMNWVEENETVTMTPPEAGFTGFPEYKLDTPSEQLCRALLNEKKVLLSPGTHFGKEGYLRINTGSKNEALVEGLRRLGESLDGGKTR